MSDNSDIKKVTGEVSRELSDMEFLNEISREIREGHKKAQEERVLDVHSMEFLRQT